MPIYGRGRKLTAWGNGDWVDHQRRTDVHQLWKAGLIQPGAERVLHPAWCRGWGVPVGTVRLTWTAHLRRQGSGRAIGIPWFVCDRCDRRARHFYEHAGGLRCWKCAGLKYKSPYLDAGTRALRDALKLRQQLGQVSPRTGMPLPPRPRGMWRRTYIRLCGSILTLEGAWLRADFAGAAKLQMTIAEAKRRKRERREREDARADRNLARIHRELDRLLRELQTGPLIGNSSPAP